MTASAIMLCSAYNPSSIFNPTCRIVLHPSHLQLRSRFAPQQLHRSLFLRRHGILSSDQWSRRIISKSRRIKAHTVAKLSGKSSQMPEPAEHSQVYSHHADEQYCTPGRDRSTQERGFPLSNVWSNSALLGASLLAASLVLHAAFPPPSRAADLSPASLPTLSTSLAEESWAGKVGVRGRVKGTADALGMQWHLIMAALRRRQQRYALKVMEGRKRVAMATVLKRMRDLTMERGALLDAQLALEQGKKQQEEAQSGGRKKQVEASSLPDLRVLGRRVAEAQARVASAASALSAARDQAEQYSAYLQAESKAKGQWGPESAREEMQLASWLWGFTPRGRQRLARVKAAEAQLAAGRAVETLVSKGEEVAGREERRRSRVGQRQSVRLGGARGAARVSARSGGQEKEEEGEEEEEEAGGSRGTVRLSTTLGVQQWRPKQEADRSRAGGRAPLLVGVGARQSRGSAAEARLGELTPARAALGWLAWAHRQKTRHKAELLRDPARARAYVAGKKNALLAARDNVMAQVYLEEARGGTGGHRLPRWVMPLPAVMTAVENHLLAEVRMRHDKEAMWVRLKGEEAEEGFGGTGTVTGTGTTPRYFYVDLTHFNLAQQRSGGSELLLLQCQAMGVPCSVEVMWVTLRRWDAQDALLLPARATWAAVRHVASTQFAHRAWRWYVYTAQVLGEEMFREYIYPRLSASLRCDLYLKYPRYELSEEENAKVARRIEWFIDAGARVAQVYSATSLVPPFVLLAARIAIVVYPVLCVVLPTLTALRFCLSPAKVPENETQAKGRLADRLWRDVRGVRQFFLPNPLRKGFADIRYIEDPAVRVDDISGVDLMAEDVAAIVAFLTDPSRFTRLGARPPRGVLITGQPGVGKTSLVYAIAAQAGVPIVQIAGSDMQGQTMVGSAANSVRALFKAAKSCAPLILLVEDFEFFAAARGRGLDTSKQESESMLNQLLVELDGFGSLDGVVVMGTSRNPNAIDPAVLRPGRVDIRLDIPLPNQRERKDILLAAAGAMDGQYRDAVDWDLVARNTHYMTPRDLKAVPQSMEMAAVAGRVHDKDELQNYVSFVEVYTLLLPDALRRTAWFQEWERSLMAWLGLRPTPAEMQKAVALMDFSQMANPGMDLVGQGLRKWRREEKYPHAVWAAGRGLLAALLPNYDTPACMWINRNSSEGIGFTKMTPYLSSSFQSTAVTLRSHSEKKLTHCFGSHCAAVLLLDTAHMNTLSNPQLEEAEQMVAKMVLSQGWSPTDSPVVLKVPYGNRSSAMGYESELQLEAYARQLYDAACEKAGEILSRNRKTLEVLVEVLVANEAVDSEDLEEIMRKTGAVPEEEPFQLTEYRPPAERKSGKYSQNGKLFLPAPEAISA